MVEPVHLYYNTVLDVRVILFLCSFAIETTFPLSNFKTKHIFGILMILRKYLKLWGAAGSRNFGRPKFFIFYRRRRHRTPGGRENSRRRRAFRESFYTIQVVLKIYFNFSPISFKGFRGV